MRLPRLGWLNAPRPFWVLPPVLLGVAVLAFAVASGRAPQQRPATERARVLSTTHVERRSVSPRIVAYGLAGPARAWRAIARVSGEVVVTHENLDAGEIVTSGEILVRIDPTDYELRIDQLLAEADGLRARLAETRTSRDNDQAMLEIEERSLALARRDLDRLERLHASGTVTTATLEQNERSMLQQQRTVQTLRSSLNLVPAQIRRLEADLAAVEKRLAEARRDLERTVVRAPFDGRLANVEIEVGQHVATNELMFDVHGIDAVDVEARLPIDDLQRLARPEPTSYGSARTRSLEDLVRGLSATVRVRSGDFVSTWPAELVRIRERVDHRTRTLGVVVEVRRPEETRNTGGPPLLDGTFCEVEFAGDLRPNQLVVPVAAVRTGQVFVVDDESRLARRDVSTVFVLSDEVVVKGNLEEGETVVVGDPSPAVDGMLVDAVDVETEHRDHLAAFHGGVP